MRVHWEKLGPVHHLAGQGFSAYEIAGKLNISEDNVRRCVAWLLHSGPHDGRAELVRDASPAPKSADSKPECAAVKEAS